MKLNAGTARRIITPKLGGLFAGYGSPKPSEYVHDELTATAVALSYGETKIILLSVTVCLIGNELVEIIRKKCGEASGVSHRNIIISCVHTHTGPVLPGIGDDYCDNILIPMCAEAAGESVKNLSPVTMGVAKSVSLVGINRRQMLPDGKIILGQNPWGAYDSEMTVISFKNDDGTPAANIIHCAAHNTAAGIEQFVSRDWCGVMIDRLEKESGATTAFFNGAAGDVAPRMANGGSTGNLELMMEIGALAGLDAVRTYKDIREYRDADLSVITDVIKIEYDPIKPLETAKKEYAAIEHSEARFDVPAKKLLLKIIALHENGENGPADFKMEQTLIKIGPVVIVPFPFEPSSEISLRLRRYSKYGHTLLFGYANGSNSYLPSQDQMCRGGYEIERFKWAAPRQLPEDADTKIINENLRIMEGFK